MLQGYVGVLLDILKDPSAKCGLKIANPKNPRIGPFYGGVFMNLYDAGVFFCCPQNDATGLRGQDS